MTLLVPETRLVGVNGQPLSSVATPPQSTGAALAATLRDDRVFTQDLPPEWDRELREITPIRMDASWLTFRWQPMRRQDASGTWHDAGRWTLYDCLPVHLASPADAEILAMLADTPPSRLPADRRVGRLLFVDDWMCEMYQTHRVWARPCWVLQGTQGGHPVVYQPEEQAVLKARGLPTDPPAIGELPYAPFDGRAKRQLIRRNKLIQAGNDLHALRQQTTAQADRARQQNAEKLFRAEYLRWLEEQCEPSAEFLQSYSRTTDCRNTLPAASRAQLDAASRLHDEFIETGVVPYAPDPA